MLSSKQLRDEIGNILLKDTKRIATSIDFLQKDVNELSSFICLEPRIQNFITSHETNSNYSLEPLSNLLASKDYISFIILYSLNGNKYYFSNDNSSEIIDLSSFKELSIYNTIIKAKGAPVWFSVESLSEPIIIRNKYSKIAMARVILNFNTYQPAGILIMCINIPTIEKIYTDDLIEKKASSLILDQSGNIIAFQSSTNKFGISFANAIIKKFNLNLQDSFLTIEKSKVIITSNEIPTTNWRFVNIVSLENVMDKIKKSIVFLYIRIAIICLIVAFIISIYFSSLLTLPLQKLAASMKKVREGHLREKVNLPLYANDEVSLLVSQYNEMIEKINELVNKIFKLEIHKKEAELKALESQINPHFLYNTLDTIFWRAEKSKDSEISEMIYALSKLFRLTLNRGNEFIQIRGEKEFIESYLFLQSKRYKNKLKYQIQIPDEILNYYIPKLILQPFVENAIVHGIENNNSESIIEVTGKKEGEFINFTIKDNGIGIDEDKIKKIKDSLKSSNTKEEFGYAIKNVNERLRLYYEDNYKLDINSKIGVGTEVSILLPLNIFRSVN